MAYRIAALGLATLLATSVVAQPVAGGADVYVTTTCTEQASVTVTVDQNGKTLLPDSGKAPEVKAAKDDTKGKHGNVLNYGNFQQKHKHHYKPPTYTPPKKEEEDTTPPPVVDDSKKETPKEEPKEEPKETPKETPSQDDSSSGGNNGGNNGGGGGGSGMGPGLSVRANSEPVGSAISSAAGNKLGWYHNWEPTPKAGGISGMTFCPMLHDTWGGDAQMWIQAWGSKPSSKCYLGQNEPDLTGQDAGQVAQDFATHFKGLGGGDDTVVACPSFTSDQSDGNKGLGWYKKFEQACAGISGCSYNTLQPHYYGYKPESGTPAGYFGKSQPGFQNFKDFVADVKKAANGKKVWMTEYALGPADGNPITDFTEQERAQFITDATEYLQGQVDAYSPYTVGENTAPGSNEMHTKDCDLAKAFVQAC